MSPDSLNTPTELPLWTENDSQEAPPEGGEWEPFLGLPAPATPESEYMKLRLWNQEYSLTPTMAKLALKRTFKSALLVLKVSLLRRRLLMVADSVRRPRRCLGYMAGRRTL